MKEFTKKFGGKIYKAHSTTTTKADAIAAAKRWRERKLYASVRVAKAPAKIRKQKGANPWWLWTRG